MAQAGLTDLEAALAGEQAVSEASTRKVCTSSPSLRIV